MPRRAAAPPGEPAPTCHRLAGRGVSGRGVAATCIPLLLFGLGLGLASGSVALWAQSPSESVTGPSMPTQLPLSGQGAQAGAVSVMQGTTNAGGGNTVDSIQSSVMVGMPYGGSVPTGVLTPGPLSLTLADALKRGMQNNLGAISQSAAVSQSEGQRGVAKSTLLPNLNTGVSEVFERENLRTLGVNFPGIPEAVKFNYIDGRAARLNQSVFDLVRIDNLRSASESLKASIKAVHNARDLIVLAVGGSYLQLIATQSRIVAAQAQVESDKALPSRRRIALPRGSPCASISNARKSSWEPISSGCVRCRPIVTRRCCSSRASSACRSDNSFWWRTSTATRPWTR